MPRSSAQIRFLLRGSALLILLLGIWWFLLLNPLVAVLRISVETAGGLFLGGRSADLVRETSSGDWTMHVPIEATVPATPERSASQVHSIDFDMARSDVNGFTFSLAVYWAVILAAPNLRRNLRALLLGSAVMAMIEFLLFMVFAEICAHKALGEITQAQGELKKWLLRSNEYLIVSALPYAVPFVLALCWHGELRQQILGWGKDTATPLSTPPAPRKARPSRSETRSPGTAG